MILYEVRLSVERTIEAEYRAWLEHHIQAMLSLPGFEGAELLREEGSAERAVFVAHYWLRDRVALETYLRDHAAAMRDDGIARFGNLFTADRRVLELDRRFTEA